MRTVELGRTGEQVSRLALGAMLMGTLTDEADSFAILDRYVEAGGTFVDSANCYAWWPRPGDRGGESEELLGRWIARRGRRDDIFLATKGTAWVGDPDAVRGKPLTLEEMSKHYEGASADTVRRAVDDSLRRLGTDHIDLYYVHVDDLATPLEETLEALAEVVRAGKVRYLGWSNVRTWRLERIRQLCDRYGWPAPVALQQQHSFLRQRPGSDVRTIVNGEQLDYLRSHPDLTLVAYSPMLKGLYNDPAGKRSMIEPYAGADTEARLTAVTELAAELGVLPTQLVVAWLLRQTSPAVVPLVGPRTLAQFRAALPALDIKLTDDQLDALDRAGA
jgi:aryl-alcohol dehydrogenase-like predicted oxidoreductase